MLRSCCLLSLWLLLAPTVVAATGRVHATFTVDAPFAEVAHKLDSDISLRRVLASQRIELLDYERTRRNFNLFAQTMDAEINIRGQADWVSPYPGNIRQTVKMGPGKARLHFALVEPLGQLAEHEYTVDFIASGEQTEITVDIRSRVFVPRFRLCCLQRMVNNVARRRLYGKLHPAIYELERTLEAIVSEARPPEARSILMQ